MAQGFLEKSAIPLNRERSSWPCSPLPGALSPQGLRKEIYSKEIAPSPPRASCRMLGQHGHEATAANGAAGNSFFGAGGITLKSAVTSLTSAFKNPNH